MSAKMMAARAETAERAGVSPLPPTGVLHISEKNIFSEGPAFFIPSGLAHEPRVKEVVPPPAGRRKGMDSLASLFRLFSLRPPYPTDSKTGN
jgi:hypothetical protein